MQMQLRHLFFRNQFHNQFERCARRISEWMEIKMSHIQKYQALDTCLYYTHMHELIRFIRYHRCRVLYIYIYMCIWFIVDDHNIDTLEETQSRIRWMQIWFCSLAFISYLRKTIATLSTGLSWTQSAYENQYMHQWYT